MYEGVTYGEREYTSLKVAVSTNNILKETVKSSEEAVFAVVSADIQTGGRGRLGRDFFSPDGGLYFSVSYPLSGNETNIPFMTLLAGLAVSEAIECLTGIRTQIKWPNDIYLNGKKLGGILCELVSGKKLTAIAGIGINLSVLRQDIPSELISRMTSFAAEGFPVPHRTVLMKRITERLDKYIYENGELFGVHKKTLESVRLLSYSIGKKVSYTVGGTVLEGTVTDITETGAVRVLLSDGTVKEIFFGEITQ